MNQPFGNAYYHFRASNGSESSMADSLINVLKPNAFYYKRDFKRFRLLAISHTLALQVTSTTSSRVKRDALLLTAACVWLLNGLRERPEDGPSWRSLMAAVLPITNEDDHLLLAHGGDGHVDDDLFTGTPYYPYGVIFLRRIHFEGDTLAPRMKCGGSFLSLPAVQDLFGEPEENVRKRYLSSAELHQGLHQA